MKKVRRARTLYYKGQETPPISQIGLTDFKRQTWPGYRHSYHLDCLDRVLERVVLYIESKGKDPRGIKNLAISIPRRYGKSTTAECCAEWFLGRNPNYRLMVACYGTSLATKMSKSIRNRLRSPQYQKIFPHIKLSGDSKSAQMWDLEGYDGGCNAMSLSGSATGFGFHFLIVDDPIRNRKDAESQTVRDAVSAELRDSVISGANARHAGIIMIGTRWHGDDPIGRILSEEGDDWVVFRLPAIIDKPYTVLDHDGGILYERQPDEALWEEKHTLEELRDIQMKVGPYSWASLWQQEPIEAQGNVFKREWMLTIPKESVPELRMVVRSWDLAMSDKDSADFTAGVKVGIDDEGNLYILDVFRARVEFGDLHDTLLTVMQYDGADVHQGIEKAGYMSRVIESLVSDNRAHRYAISPLTVDKDKLTRSLPVASRFSANKAFIVKGGWNKNYIEELVAFSGKGSKHDDQVDATSGAYAMLEDSYVPEGFTFW